jgi:hypothetical protein
MALAITLAMTIACVSNAPPRRTAGSTEHLTDCRLFLVAAQQKAEISASLRSVGFQLADDLLDAPYFLRVTLGNEQGSRSCGALQNVKYSLRRDGIEVLSIAGKGWSGSCQPNVFDLASRELAAAFEGSCNVQPAEGGPS